MIDLNHILNSIKMFFLNKQQAVKVKVSKDVTKDRSWKCSKIIINVAYTNRPILSF